MGSRNTDGSNIEQGRKTIRRIGNALTESKDRVELNTIMESGIVVLDDDDDKHQISTVSLGSSLVTSDSITDEQVQLIDGGEFVEPVTPQVVINYNLPSGPAGGDLAGLYPEPQVSGIAGIALSGQPQGGEVLVYESGSDLWGYTNLVDQIQSSAPAVEIEVQDEGFSVGAFTALNFIGNMIGPSDGGSGVSNITVSPPNRLTRTLTWSNSSSPKTAGVFSGRVPGTATFLFAGSHPAGSGVALVGMSIGQSNGLSDCAAIGTSLDDGGGNDNTARVAAQSSSNTVGGMPGTRGFTSSFITDNGIRFELTKFDEDGITVEPNDTVTGTMFIFISE